MRTSDRRSLLRDSGNAKLATISDSFSHGNAVVARAAKKIEGVAGYITKLDKRISEFKRFQQALMIIPRPPPKLTLVPSKKLA